MKYSFSGRLMLSLKASLQFLKELQVDGTVKFTDEPLWRGAKPVWTAFSLPRLMSRDGSCLCGPTLNSHIQLQGYSVIACWGSIPAGWTLAVGPLAWLLGEIVPPRLSPRMRGACWGWGESTQLSEMCGLTASGQRDPEGSCTPVVAGSESINKQL